MKPILTVFCSLLLVWPGFAKDEQPNAVSADDGGLPAGENTTNRGSYYVNGEIHVNTYGQPEGKPLTTGHHDFKPSWSKTGDMLVFFRRVKNDPDVSKWKTAIHIIHADGTGLH